MKEAKDEMVRLASSSSQGARAGDTPKTAIADP